MRRTRLMCIALSLMLLVGGRPAGAEVRAVAAPRASARRSNERQRVRWSCSQRSAPADAAGGEDARPAGGTCGHVRSFSRSANRASAGGSARARGWLQVRPRRTTSATGEKHAAAIRPFSDGRDSCPGVSSGAHCRSPRRARCQRTCRGEGGRVRCRVRSRSRSDRTS